MITELETGWRTILKTKFDETQIEKLYNAVSNAYSKEAVYPHLEEIFTAFALTPPETLKVVILGQDPYHGAGQAHGLAFSVREGVAIPPSLRNIFKEIQSDLGITPPQSGDLTRWAKQGVLLLNTTLTVRAGEAGSHRELGWEQFTDTVIKLISEKNEHVVFMLWGNHAQAKATLINTSKHLVLTAPHPSPLSAHRGFFGCRHFSKANEYLSLHDIKPIDW